MIYLECRVVIFNWGKKRRLLMEKKKVAVFIADIYAPMIKEIQYGLMMILLRVNILSSLNMIKGIS